MPIDSNALINSRETTDEEISGSPSSPPRRARSSSRGCREARPSSAPVGIGKGSGAAGINGPHGGAEGVPTLFKLAHMDKDGNGEIAQKELEIYLERARTASTACWSSAQQRRLWFARPQLHRPGAPHPARGVAGDDLVLRRRHQPGRAVRQVLAHVFDPAMQLTFFFCSATMFYPAGSTRPPSGSLTLESRMWFLANSPVAVNLLNSSILLISKPRRGLPGPLRGRVGSPAHGAAQCR